MVRVKDISKVEYDILARLIKVNGYWIIECSYGQIELNECEDIEALDLLLKEEK